MIARMSYVEVSGENKLSDVRNVIIYNDREMLINSFNENRRTNNCGGKKRHNDLTFPGVSISRE